MPGLRAVRKVLRGSLKSSPKPAPLLEDNRLHQAFRFVGYLLHTSYHLGTRGLGDYSEAMLRQAHTHGYSAEIAFAAAARAANRQLATIPGTTKDGARSVTSIVPY